MLESERHHLILKLLTHNQTVRLQEIADETGSSESTIRRDLINWNVKKVKACSWWCSEVAREIARIHNV